MERFGIETLKLFKDTLKSWEVVHSTKDNTSLKTYFIHLHFDQYKEQKQRNFLNTMPTSFALSEQQINVLIKAGKDLLNEHPVYKKFLSDIRN
jgi:NTE family protein